jgi:hypothetical protein
MIASLIAFPTAAISADSLTIVRSSGLGPEDPHTPPPIVTTLCDIRGTTDEARKLLDHMWTVNMRFFQHKDWSDALMEAPFDTLTFTHEGKNTVLMTNTSNTSSTPDNASNKIWFNEMEQTCVAWAKSHPTHVQHNEK